MAELAATLPPWFLILVARGHGDLVEYLRQTFRAETGIEVRYERRLTDRRQRADTTRLERRRRDRRTTPPVDADVRRFGFAIVPRP